MMKGNNSFSFNEATMIQIVQYYLDNKLLQEINQKVTSVREDRTTSYATTFTITVEETPTNAQP